MFRNELEHCKPVDNLEDWYAEQVYAAADRECIWTQDNWDVVNLFRCELDDFDLPPLAEWDDIDHFMAAAAWRIWEQLIREALDA